MVCEHEYMNIATPNNYRARYTTEISGLEQARKFAASHQTKDMSVVCGYPSHAIFYLLTAIKNTEGSRVSEHVY